MVTAITFTDSLGRPAFSAAFATAEKIASLFF
ncbi:hypothetical protein SSU98_0477 [Streptococcus suis 98HAH33]|nr:hypothetical protein SSU05_0483 [Streptococcus suis 05ZYH33]ABP91634.1 hypothetical protein SSU98_0477 [Streptococcus suis 98HAH33]